MIYELYDKMLGELSRERSVNDTLTDGSSFESIRTPEYGAVGSMDPEEALEKDLVSPVEMSNDILPI